MFCFTYYEENPVKPNVCHSVKTAKVEGNKKLRETYNVYMFELNISFNFAMY